MPEFKPGDRVLCINSRSAYGNKIGALEAGTEYTVSRKENATGNYIYLEEVSGGWNPDRFVPVAASTEQPINSQEDNKVSHPFPTMKIRVFVSGTQKDWAVSGSTGWAEPHHHLTDYGHDTGYWLNLEVPVPQDPEYTMVGYEFRQTTSTQN